MSVLKEIYAYREMIYNLVRKDLRGKYMGTALGFLWTFVNPLLQLIVYNMVFSMILRSHIEKFYLFLFIGLVPWTFTSACLTGGSTSVVSESHMVTKIYFPREALPVAFVTSAFATMLLCFLVVFLVVFLSGVPVNILTWLFLIPVMLLQYIMGLGIAMITSAVTVYFRDLQHILGVAQLAWMFLTPIMYDINIVPAKLLPVFYLNPMVPIVTAYRDILYYAKFPALGTLSSAFIFGVVILVLGFLAFGRLKRGFAEEL